MTNNIPRVVFLGIAERANQVREGNTNLSKINLLGLKSILLSHVFPLSIGGTNLVFALYDPINNPKTCLKFQDAEGKELGFINIDVDSIPKEEIETHGPLIQTSKDCFQLTDNNAGWATIIVPNINIQFSIQKPGIYNIVIEENNSKLLVGKLVFFLVDPEPLTEARKAAILSDPASYKAIRIDYKCHKCNMGIRTYAGLERIQKEEQEGFTWYQDLPSEFKCNCGQANTSLEIYKKNLHGLLGARPIGNEATFIPQYETGAIENIYKNFNTLLNGKIQDEETFQKFISNNPLLLHAFSPSEIFPKAPIMSLRKTDFAILTPHRELILIELEKPITKLLKKDGGTHSELQHAFDQVREWLDAIKDHKLAVLKCIGIEPEQVASVKGFVIAGRDTDYNKEHLKKLKGSELGPISFRTYDDLLASLGTIISKVK